MKKLIALKILSGILVGLCIGAIMYGSTLDAPTYDMAFYDDEQTVELTDDAEDVLRACIANADYQLSK